MTSFRFVVDCCGVIPRVLLLNERDSGATFLGWEPRVSDWDVNSFPRGLRKWISAARQKEANPTPAPSAVESPGNLQLQKLLAKEEQRLEQEQKRAAIERRRKQQQERFQLQHELNHPLRQHHMQQKTRTLKGILTASCWSRDLGHHASVVWQLF